MVSVLDTQKLWVPYRPLQSHFDGGEMLDAHVLSIGSCKESQLVEIAGDLHYGVTHNRIAYCGFGT